VISVSQRVHTPGSNLIRYSITWPANIRGAISPTIWKRTRGGVSTSRFRGVAKKSHTIAGAAGMNC
jgi:hypothetical protein